MGRHYLFNRDRVMKALEHKPTRQKVMYKGEDETWRYVLFKSAEKPLVAVFVAPWAEASRSIMPMVEQLRRDYENRIFVAQVDVRDAPELCRQMKLRRLPAVAVYRFSRRLFTSTPPVSMRDVRQHVRRALKMERETPG